MIRIIFTILLLGFSAAQVQSSQISSVAHNIPGMSLLLFNEADDSTPGNLPQVSFSKPDANQEFNVADEIIVEVSATNDGGQVERVDLYVDNELRSSESSSPYAWSLDDLSPGPHSLKVVAVSDDEMEAEAIVSISVKEETIVPPDGRLKAGRGVKNVLRTPAVDVSLATSNHNNFRNWRVVTDSNASVAVSSAAVTFTRNVANDGSDAQAYVDFQVGALWPDKDVSFCFEVSDYSESSQGVRNAGLEVVSSGLTGTKSRTVTQNGTYCTVLSLSNKLESTTVNLGLGVTGSDTRTNSITISKFSVSPTNDGLPNEYVRVDQRGQTVSKSGISGASFNYPKNVSYDAASGLTSFVKPSTIDNSPSASHVLAITDSFGGFKDFGVWATFYGFDDSGSTPNYVVTMNNQPGRSLVDSTPTTSNLLDSMLAEAIAKNPDDGAPGICWLAQGVNDIHVKVNTAEVTFAHLQAHINWCTDNGMFPVVVTAGPFNGFGSTWKQFKEDRRNDYNAQVRSLVENSNNGIGIVDYDLLLDVDRDGILDDIYNFDRLHPNEAGYAVLSAEADKVFNRVINSVSNGTNKVGTDIADPSSTD